MFREFTAQTTKTILNGFSKKLFLGISLYTYVCKKCIPKGANLKFLFDISLIHTRVLFFTSYTPNCFSPPEKKETKMYNKSIVRVI